jgi:site-specific recombinase XerD
VQEFELLDAEICRATSSRAVRKLANELNLTVIPEGFPFLVSAERGRVIEPALSFLSAKYVVRELPGRPSRARHSGNSHVAIASDLRDFYGFLDAQSAHISNITVEHVNSYAGSMIGKRSASGSVYAYQTIVRRMSTVRAFVTWLQDEGRLQNRFPVVTIPGQRGAYNRRPAMHQVDAGQVFGEGDDDIVVNVLTMEEIHHLLTSLGPRPSESVSAQGTKRSRNRLFAELALNTGLRRTEVTEVSLATFLKAMERRNRKSKFSKAPIRIRGKGRKWRKVLVPCWLLDEVRIYIEGERARAIEAGKKLTGKTFVEPSTLFVNASNATVRRGQSCGSDTLYSAFKAPQDNLVEAKLLSQSFRLHELPPTA